MTNSEKCVIKGDLSRTAVLLPRTDARSLSVRHFLINGAELMSLLVLAYYLLNATDLWGMANNALAIAAFQTVIKLNW